MQNKKAVLPLERDKNSFLFNVSVFFLLETVTVLVDHLIGNPAAGFFHIYT